MRREYRNESEQKPISIFEWCEESDRNQIQLWLELAPFDEKALLHLPDHDVVTKVQDRLTQLAKRDNLTTKDMLMAYHELRVTVHRVESVS